MKVITFSSKFPATHPRKSEPTFFVEKIVKSLHRIGIKPFDVNCDFSEEMYYVCDPKNHTIRAGSRWTVGEFFSPRIWSGKPYASKQIEFAPPIEIKKIWPVQIEIDEPYHVYVLIPQDKKNEFEMLPTSDVAKNDGLSFEDFKHWFKPYCKKREDSFNGQIICWNDKIEY